MVGFVAKNKRVGVPPQRYLENALGVVDGAVPEEARAAFEDRVHSNMYGRTGLIFDVREYRFDAPREPHPPETITVCCVSSQINVTDTTSHQPGDLELKPFRDGCALLERTCELKAEEWEDLRRAELDEALEEDPDIICFGELAYPAPPPTQLQGWSVEGIYNYGLGRSRFEQRVLQSLRAKQKKPFVFLGSFHCPLTLYNVGVIYPLGDLQTEARVRIRSEKLEGKSAGISKRRFHERVPMPLLYRKRFPARRAGESLRVPPSEEFHIYDLPIGRIAVLICSDVVDLNQSLTIARRNGPSEKYEPIDFVLVPSFNESAKFASMCQELSYLARTTVVVVNANHGIGKFNASNLYCCGLNLTELNKLSSTSVVSMTMTPVDQFNRTSQIITFKIDNTLIRNLRDTLHWAALEDTPTSSKIAAATKT